MNGVKIHPDRPESSVRKNGELVQHPIMLEFDGSWIYLTHEELREIAQKHSAILMAQQKKRDAISEGTFPTEPGMYVRTDDAAGVKDGGFIPQHIFVLLPDGAWTTASGTSIYDRGTVLSHHRASPLVRLGVQP